jgi:hypothetical protein
MLVMGLPMSSHADPARPNPCRNPFTRSPWTWPLLLLIVSPLSRALAVGGTMAFGTGCAEPTYDDCDQWQTECLEICAPDDAQCRDDCELDHDGCIEEADLAKQRQAERVDAISEASRACFAVAICTLESVGNPHSEDDESPTPEPEPEPDSTDDSGEQSPSAEVSDLPEE